MKKVTEVMKLKIRELHSQKISLSQIGKLLKINEGTVAYWANEERREKRKIEGRTNMKFYTQLRDAHYKEVGIRLCPKCNQSKNPDQFYKGQRICKTCQDIYNNEYFKTYRKTEQRKTYLRTKRQIHKKEIAVILGGKCVDCERPMTDDTLCAFDFHHLDILDKERRDECRCKQFIKKVNDGKIVLLCAFCHQVRHHKNGDRSYRVQHISKRENLS